MITVSLQEFISRYSQSITTNPIIGKSLPTVANALEAPKGSYGMTFLASRRVSSPATSVMQQHVIGNTTTPSTTITSSSLSGTSILAVDYGSQKIGLAYAPSLHGIVHSLGVVRAPLNAQRDSKVSFFIKETLHAMARQQASCLVVGWPLEPSGREGEGCKAVRLFAQQLLTSSSSSKSSSSGSSSSSIYYPSILLWDERGSSAIARDRIREDLIVKQKLHNPIKSVGDAVRQRRRLMKPHLIAGQRNRQQQQQSPFSSFDDDGDQIHSITESRLEVPLSQEQSKQVDALAAVVILESVLSTALSQKLC